MGVNQNLGPVADVNVNPRNPVIGVRSFASDPEMTADLTAAAVRGYERDARISATPKHFPGHGDTETGSHTGIPEIKHTREQWEQLDAPPFEAAINADVDSMMTAHIVVPALDPARDPATLSRPIMTGILRQELGYDGVVITDSLGMAGVREMYGDAEVPLRAIEAGVDQLLRPPEMDVAYNSVLDAVQSGRISERRLDRSVLEATNLSEGRGSTRPFELIGAPYLDFHWAEALNEAGIPGVQFREAYFVPTFSKHVGEVCAGVQVHITDPHEVEAITTATHMIVEARRLYDGFDWRGAGGRWIDLLTGSDRFRSMLEADASAAEIVAAWRKELAEFDRRRRPYLLYRK
ncbi:MAG: glycoside hydrolase family 3 N-terminal domain-containing protein [Nocardioidaceae bacterium]